MRLSIMLSDICAGIFQQYTAMSLVFIPQSGKGRGRQEAWKKEKKWKDKKVTKKRIERLMRQ